MFKQKMMKVALCSAIATGVVGSFEVIKPSQASAANVSTQTSVIGENYVKTHTSLIKNVRKTAEIESVLVTKENLELFRDLNKKFCKEGPLPVELGFMFVLKNGNANPYYAMPKSEFNKKYSAHPNGKKDTYIAIELRKAIKINDQFSVKPSWMNGQIVTSEKHGGWLMIYGPNDYNICSFEDFDKTYVINNLGL